jgi:toxin ParE1/3/4
LPEFSVSRAARKDLREIARYTVGKWGANQAVRYATGLQRIFQSLADHPSMGRSCDDLVPGMRRLEHGKHVVYYLPMRGEVLIVRVLHQQMIPTPAHFEP